MTDIARFEAFVGEYQDMVYATAVRLLSSPAEAEDIAQTVFLKAFERFDDIGASPAVAGWLKTVTTNLCLNHLSRYRSRWRLFSELQPLGRDDADHRDHVDVLMTRASGDGSRGDRTRPRRCERAGTPGAGASQAAGSSAGADRPLSFREQELSGNRGAARRDAGEGEDRHPSRPRGPEDRADIDSCSPMISKTSSIGR